MKKIISFILLCGISFGSIVESYADFTLVSSNTITSNTVNLVGQSSAIGMIITVREGNAQLCQSVVPTNSTWNCTINNVTSGAHTYEFYEGNVLSRSVTIIVGGSMDSTINTSVPTNPAVVPQPVFTNIVSPYPSIPLSAWQIIHQSIIDKGFTWTGAVAQYASGGMIQTNNTSLTGGLIRNCLTDEEEKVFRIDSSIDEDVVTGLAKLAKHCAVGHYGNYFQGKKYTTREEYLMTLFSLFNEDVELNGYFTKYGKYVPYQGFYTFSGFGNVSPTAWFAPVLVKAKEFGLIKRDYIWKVAKPLTRIEAMEMLVKMIEKKTGSTIAQNSTLVFIDLSQDSDVTTLSRDDQDFITVQKSRTIGATHVFEGGTRFQKTKNVRNEEMVSILSDMLRYFRY